MPGDPFKNVTPGQRLEIPAAAYNAFLDAARQARGNLHDTDRDANALMRQSGIVRVRNTTGADLNRFAVVSLNAPIITPADNLQEFQNAVIFDGVVPTAVLKERFAVLLEPLAADATGRAVVSGVTVVKVRVDPAQLYDFAAVEVGETGWLRNVPHGTARVLWVQSSGSVERWAVVRLDDGDFQAHVLVTSNAPDADGYFPGEVQRYDPAMKTWQTLFACKVVDVNQ
ncbi:MAG: hypothetical protein FJ304_21325 [Planctomycetes bacterium]|nr:hypothetical protein [Planctomycetota bacterium]